MKKAKLKKDKNTKIYCDITKCVACRACELACAVEHSKTKDLAEAILEKVKPKKRLKVSAVEDKSISIHCQHCKDAPCVTACMSGALSRDEKAHATVHDKDKCVGCWMCVMVCPFGAIVRDIENHIAVKCDLCPDRDTYACVEACPTGALVAGTKAEFEKKIKGKKK
jgi:carbon-monoxide dehydrogenase iron sulfur subunit